MRKNKTKDQLIQEIQTLKERINQLGHKDIQTCSPSAAQFEHCDEYQSLFENLPQKIFIKDKNSVYLFCNKPYADMLKIEQSAIKGKTDYDFFSKEMAEKFRKDDQRIMQAGQIEHIEEPYTENGQPRIARTVKVPVKNNQGKVIQIIGIFEDITESKKAQEQINNLARFPAENPSPVMRFSLIGELIYANKAAEYCLKAWNCEQGQCVGKDIADIIAQAYECGSILTFERKCNQKIYLFTLSSILGNDYVNIYGVDITDRKQIEEALLFSNKRFEELFNNMSSGVVIYMAVDDGADFIIKDFNKAAEKIENISRTDVIDKRITEVFPGVKEFGLFDVFNRVFQTGQPEHYSDKIYHDNRISGWRRNYVYKIPSGDIIAVYDDVTEEKKLEQQEKEIFAAQAALLVEKQKAEELKIMQEQLLQSEKMASIGQLGAGVAHELNSPLAGILSLLQSYKKEKDLNSEEYKDLFEMEKATEHMVKIIKSLNVFSRQSTGEIEEVDCNEAINLTLSFTEYQFKQKSIKVEKKLNSDLWKIRANKNQVQQIIINMISNACDASSENGMFRIITDNIMLKDKAYVEMLFEDKGIGIPKENLKKIFDPFFTTKRPGGGVGLGLSIVYKIIENHKGTIDVESIEGQGTIFTVRLPVN